MRILPLSLTVLLFFVPGIAPNHFFLPDAALTTQAQQATDAAAIRAHIESICQAFIDWDIEKIRATHTEDWRDFLEGSHVPIKGIDEYMRANGIPWPQPAQPPKPEPRLRPQPGLLILREGLPEGNAASWSGACGDEEAPAAMLLWLRLFCVRVERDGCQFFYGFRCSVT